MSASGVNRPAQSDPYKANRFNAEYYFKDFLFQKNWLRRSFAYSSEIVLVCGISAVISVFAGFGMWYKESHADEYRPYVSKYTVVRKKNAIPRHIEKGMYN